MNFGSADFGVAAGALPPPPESVVLVVSVDEVSVDDVSVEDVSVLELESGVVVVIVVTTVLPPVVTVETIVVVACAPNGAAPAVNAAVAAPSVISTAKPAPQAAYFLYCLLILPPFPISGLGERPTPPVESPLQRRKRSGEEARERRSRLFNGLEIHPGPSHAPVAQAEDEDSPELERRTASRIPVGAPLAPDHVPFLDGRGNLDPEIGNVTEHLGPVPTYVFACARRSVGVTWPLAEVVLMEEVDEGVEVVRVERGTHLFDKQWCDGHQDKTLPNART